VRTVTDRGVSTVVSYVLALAIVALLSSALVGGFAPLVTNQQQEAAQSTLSVLGNDLAADLTTADRLVTDGGANLTVAVHTRLPDRVAGSHYEVAIRQPDPGETVYVLVFRTADFETGTRVTVRTRTPVETRTGTDALAGGALRIRYDQTDDELEVTHA
jgi:type II secretory pathway pseudopilin PulG